MSNKKDKANKESQSSELEDLNIDNFAYLTRITRKYSARKPYAPPPPGLMTAFIPGIITEVFVTENQQVQKGDKLVTLEAMKMLNEIRSPFDGTVKSVMVQKGDKVTKNQSLIELI
ncbi:MAG TPA: acetyl-CoA carboxylase biotin carboxyl carrier protein subunit [Bacteroidales bacterium]|nr:acetyl-CoA carboxylase biotin carboxyl carrier protein subunit [Bacteroidales bacterium]